jgi:hypothetical protein
MSFDSLVSSCLDRLAGFTDQHATWAQTLFRQQQRANNIPQVDLYSNESVLANPDMRNETKMVGLPESAYLVSFSRDINYRAVCDYLSDKKLELAPVQVLLSTLLTNFKTTPYKSRAFDGSPVNSVDHHLNIPGPTNTQHRTVLAAGGYLKCDGINRDTLFGARTGSKGLEFFLPYTTNVDSGGWRAGTLFLVQPKNRPFG